MSSLNIQDRLTSLGYRTEVVEAVMSELAKKDGRFRREKANIITCASLIRILPLYQSQAIDVHAIMRQFNIHSSSYTELQKLISGTSSSSRGQYQVLDIFINYPSDLVHEVIGRVIDSSAFQFSEPEIFARVANFFADTVCHDPRGKILLQNYFREMAMALICFLLSCLDINKLNKIQKNIFSHLASEGAEKVTFTQIAKLIPNVSTISHIIFKTPERQSHFRVIFEAAAQHDSFLREARLRVN